MVFLPTSVWAPPYGGDNGSLGGSIDGWLISGDADNDTINHVSCGDGTDTWQSDPTDDRQTFAYAGPPNTNGDCETRTPPVGLDTTSIP